MSTNSCSFVVWADAPGSDGLVEARARALERFYRPAGLAGTTCTQVLADRAWVGTIGGEPSRDAVLSWGAPFGAVPATRESVFAAEEELRRSMVGLGMAAAWSEETLRVLTAPSGPVGLYAATGPQLRVWATHAVAAGYLARGSVELDPGSIPELVAYDFVGATRTTIEGVAPVPAAQRIDLTASAVTTGCWWPSAERWAVVPEADAHAHTSEALLDSLDTRTGSKQLGLALTAGADSRVLAVALHELGKQTSAFCWGDPGWPDVEGARTVASELGMPFAEGASWRPDARLRTVLDGEARWSDGRAILSLSEREWPDEAGAIALGAAGEVGRCFYYRRHIDGPEPHEPSELAYFLRAEDRLRGASPSAQETANASVAAWLEQAAKSGHRGWRLLDVLYAEQRVGCWGRIQLPALAADIVAGFSPQQVVRGLASLPLTERGTDGFHRRFVADRHPRLALEPPAGARTPPRWRQPLTRVRRRFGHSDPARPAADPLLVSLWAERPATRDWVAEEVLGSRLIRDTLGEGWATATREGFLAGRKRACEQAAAACAPVALATALADLG